jgi:hypothetical protein
VIDSSEEDFEQPSDEDAQRNVLTMRQMNIDGVDNTNQNPNKHDTKPASKEEEQETSTSTKRQNRRLRKYDDENEKMKNFFVVFTANTQNK